MEIDFSSLIPLDLLRTDLDYVLSLAHKKGKVILISENRPVFVLEKCELSEGASHYHESGNFETLTLHEAMQIVLQDAPERTMHVAALADEIYKRRLYTKKNGGKAEYSQLRARCEQYKDLFTVLPKNYVKLLMPLDLTK